MTLRGKAVVASWSNIAPSVIDDVRDWHSREHMPERLGLPGFLRGRRYSGLDDPGAWFILYEAETLAVLTSPAYLARLNDPTPWTRRSIVHLGNSMRGIGVVGLSSGESIGGFVGTIRIAARDTDAIDRSLLLKQLDQPGIIGIHSCIADPQASTIRTVESQSRPVATPRGFIIVEATTCAPLEEVISELAASRPDIYKTNLYRLELLLHCHDIVRKDC